MKAFKQEKQEDSTHRERLTVPLPPSDRALCTERPCWTRVCRWRDWTRRSHCQPWLLSARMAAWVLPPLWAAGRGLVSLWCLAPCCLGKNIKKNRSERRLVLHHQQASQGQDSHCLYPWAGLAQPPVWALAHALPPAAAHQQTLSFTYFLTQKEEK